jgi:hypothetical protein
MHVTPSAYLKNYLKEIVVFFHSETPLARFVHEGLTHSKQQFKNIFFN